MQFFLSILINSIIIYIYIYIYIYMWPYSIFTNFLVYIISHFRYFPIQNINFNLNLNFLFMFTGVGLNLVLRKFYNTFNDNIQIPVFNVFNFMLNLTQIFSTN